MLDVGYLYIAFIILLIVPCIHRNYLNQIHENVKNIIQQDQLGSSQIYGVDSTYKNQQM